jgi:hypothetical protein
MLGHLSHAFSLFGVLNNDRLSIGLTVDWFDFFQTDSYNKKNYVVTQGYATVHDFFVTFLWVFEGFML